YAPPHHEVRDRFAISDVAIEEGSGFGNGAPTTGAEVINNDSLFAAIDQRVRHVAAYVAGTASNHHRQLHLSWPTCKMEVTVKVNTISILDHHRTLGFDNVLLMHFASEDGTAAIAQS